MAAFVATSSSFIESLLVVSCLFLTISKSIHCHDLKRIGNDDDGEIGIEQNIPKSTTVIVSNAADSSKDSNMASNIDYGKSSNLSLCPTCQKYTLEDLYSEMKRRIPINVVEETTRRSHYAPPSEQNKVDYEQIVSEMMSLSLSSSKTTTTATISSAAGAAVVPAALDDTITVVDDCNNINLRSLSGKYDIGLFVVDQQQQQQQNDGVSNGYYYCVLITKSIEYPWGNVIVNLNDNNDDVGVKNISIDIPHPINDKSTGEQGIVIFQGSNARSFIVSGTYRYFGRNRSGSNYHITDAAHSTETCFIDATRAVMKFYKNIEADEYTSIQFHGMALTTCPKVDVFMTFGTKTNTAVLPSCSCSTEGGGGDCRYSHCPEAKLSILQQELYNNLNQIKDRNYHVVIPSNQSQESPITTECNLYGSTNLQGQLINGNCASENKRSEKGLLQQQDDLCIGRFIHIEQKYQFRQESMYNVWINALNSMYNKYHCRHDGNVYEAEEDEVHKPSYKYAPTEHRGGQRCFSDSQTNEAAKNDDNSNSESVARKKTTFRELPHSTTKN